MEISGGLIVMEEICSEGGLVIRRAGEEEGQNNPVGGVGRVAGMAGEGVLL